MPQLKLDKKTGRPVRPSKEDVLAKLQMEAHARREALQQKETSVQLEPWKIPVPLIDHDPDLVETPARLITVTMINGEEIELLVQSGETVGALAKRLALLKGVGRVRLLADNAPLPEELLVMDVVPDACLVTAILQYGFNSPNCLDPIAERQIRLSCELHRGGLHRGPNGTAVFQNGWSMDAEAQLDPEAFWSAAFKKQTWREFAQHIGFEDFQVRVFSFGLNPLKQARFIYYIFWTGLYGYQSIHIENFDSCTADVRDIGHGNYIIAPLDAFGVRQDDIQRFSDGLQDAAHAKHGVEKYGGDCMMHQMQYGVPPEKCRIW